LKNGTLLITGGTGSFGKAVFTRLLNSDEFDEYHSHNTKRLNMQETKEFLLKLEIIKNELC